MYVLTGVAVVAVAAALTVGLGRAGLVAGLGLVALVALVLAGGEAKRVRDGSA